MRVGSTGHVAALGRLAVVVGLIVSGLGLAPGTAKAQGEERRVVAYATCVQPAVDREPFARVKVVNFSGAPVRLIAVDGFSSKRSFRPFYAEGVADGLLDIEPADGEAIAVDARRSGHIGGDGEGLTAGAVVVTSLGVLAPVCGGRPEDSGELFLTDPPPATDQDRRAREPRSMAELLGRPERWRAHPLL